MSVSPHSVSTLLTFIPDFDFSFLLCKHHEDMLQLHVQWPTPLVSAARYVSHVHEAIQLADKLAGTVTSCNPPLQWLPPVVCIIPPDMEPEDDMGPGIEPLTDATEDADIPPEQVLLADVLEASDLEDDELEDQSPQGHLEWKVPDVSHCLSLQNFLSKQSLLRISQKTSLKCLPPPQVVPYPSECELGLPQKSSEALCSKPRTSAC